MENERQKIALHYMNLGYNIFITGGGGVGKSYVLKKFISEQNALNKNIIVTAPTGIAALNLDGVTAHRAFKIPIKPLVSVRKPKAVDIVIESDIIILDEISICRLDVFDYISRIILDENDRRKKYTRRRPIQFIVSGDFFQLPPVVSDNDRYILELAYDQQFGKGFAFQSVYWKQFKFISIALNQVIRQQDAMFIDNLNNLRLGIENSLNYFEMYSSPDEMKDAILVCGSNRKVAEKNQFELNKIKEKIVTYTAEIDGDLSPVDKPTDEILKLKVGARVMTLINDPLDKFRNGSFGEITNLEDDIITVEMDSGFTVKLSKYSWYSYDYSIEKEKTKNKLKAKVVGTFTQFPVKLAYAITIHKSQGQTYDAMNLDPYCWDCGQLYVAMSRVRDIEHLHIISRLQRKYLLTSDSVIKFYTELFSSNK